MVKVFKDEIMWRQLAVSIAGKTQRVLDVGTAVKRALLQDAPEGEGYSNFLHVSEVNQYGSHDDVRYFVGDLFDSSREQKRNKICNAMKAVEKECLKQGIKLEALKSYSRNFEKKTGVTADGEVRVSVARSAASRPSGCEKFTDSMYALWRKNND